MRSSLSSCDRASPRASVWARQHDRLSASSKAVTIYKFRKKFLNGKAQMQFPAHSITRIGLRVK
jgi:hypothetical protein